MNQFLAKFSEALKQIFNIISAFIDSIPRDEFVVVYVLNPFSLIQQMSQFNNTLSEYFCEMLDHMGQLLRTEALVRPNVVYHFLDLATITNAYEIRPLSLFKQLATDTYNRCRRVRKWQSRKVNEYFSMLHEPSLVLPPSLPCLSSGCLPDKVIERHQHIFMNCAYTVLEQREERLTSNSNKVFFCVAICTAWSDCTGHLLETDLLFGRCEIEQDTVEHRSHAREMAFGTVFQEIHNRSMMYMSSLYSPDQKAEGGQSYWNYVVCKFNNSFSIEQINSGNSCSGFDSMEMKVWRTICDQLTTRDLAIIGSMSIVSVTDDPGLQILVDSQYSHDLKNNPENGNSFIIIDHQFMADQQYFAMNNINNSNTARARAYLFSSLRSNPYLMKERQLTGASSATGSSVSLSEQEYHILEVCLFQLKQIACNPPMSAVAPQQQPHGHNTAAAAVAAATQQPLIDFLHKLCKQYHDLSWLTVTSSQPFRETYLPPHLRLLQELTKNALNYHRNRLPHSSTLSTSDNEAQ